VRLSGIVLLNTAVTRGSVDNLDFPQVATHPTLAEHRDLSPAHFANRRSELKAFGPDYSRGTYQRELEIRLCRRLFQTHPMARPLELYVCGLGRYAWTGPILPSLQVKTLSFRSAHSHNAFLSRNSSPFLHRQFVELDARRFESNIAFALSDSSKLLFQAGIVDSLTGDVSPPNLPSPNCGRAIGAAGIRNAHRLCATSLWKRYVILGIGGYYGRQNWGFGRKYRWMGRAKPICNSSAGKLL